MADIPPTLEEWRALYERAQDLKALAPWDWMDDSQFFGVRDPTTQDVGYCCILGALAQVFGLVVYLGPLGFAAYLQTQSGDEVDGWDHTLQHYLTAFLDDREELERQDLSIIRELGLKYRGRAAWPSFRSARPGFLPWFLDQTEARFLAVALEQAMVVAKGVYASPKYLDPPRTGLHLVRERRSEEPWHDTWLPPPSLPHLEAPAVDDLTLHRLRDLPQQPLSWEVHSFAAPAIMKDAERPYHLNVLLCVDHGSGFVFDVAISEPVEFHRKLPEQFLAALEKAKMRPEEIRLRSPYLLELIRPLSSKMGIKVKRVKRLPALEEAAAALEEALYGSRY